MDTNKDWDSYLRWEATTRDTIDLKKAYIDICGDIRAGVLLSQIIYWYLPGSKGKSKLRVYRNGYHWIAKRRRDWWEEVRLSIYQFDRAIDTLKELDLVETEVFKFNGTPMLHIRLLKENYLDRLVKVTKREYS